MKYIYLLLFLLLSSKIFGLFQVGDIVYNMEWIDSNNEEHSIEELTSQNKTVVIFYGSLTCSSCILSAAPFQEIWEELEYNNNVYMISNSDWGKTHTHPYCKNIGSDKLYDGRNPLMLVIGKNRVLMHFDHESGYSGENQDGILLKEAILKSIQTFKGLHITSNPKPIILKTAENKQIDMQSIFNHKLNQEISYMIMETSSNKINAEMENSILKINSNDEGFYKVLVKAISGEEELEYYVRIIVKNNFREEFYIQNDSISTTNMMPAQQFEDALSGLNSWGADDFSVPPNKTWNIEEISLSGNNSTRSSFDKFNIKFFADNNGIIGDELYNYNNLTAFVAEEKFYIELPEQLKLQEGHYWLSAQTNKTYSESADWNWYSNNGEQVGYDFFWKNAGDHNPDATDWTSASSLELVNKNLAFSFLHMNTTDITENLSIKNFTLEQNYPNPFNPKTTIDYFLKINQNVNITLYNATGQSVKELINSNIKAGNHTINFNATNLNSGVYYYKMKAGNQIITKKMIFLK